MKILKPKLNKIFINEFFIVLLGQTFSILGSFLGLRLITELVNAEVYGTTSLAIVSTQFAMQFLLGPLANAFTRNYSIAKELGDELSLFTALNKILSLLIAISLIIGLAIIFLSIVLIKFKIGIILISLIFTIFTGINTIINGIQTAARKRKIVALHQTISTWIRYGLAILLIYIIGQKALAITIGYMISSILVFVSEILFLNKTTGYKPKIIFSAKSTWSRLIYKFAFPISIWGLFSWLFSASDRWALEFFTTREIVGQYSAMYQLGFVPMTILSGIIGQYMTPIIFQQVGTAQNHIRNEKANTITNKSILYFILITLFCSIIGYLFKRPIVNLLLAEDYHIVSNLLPLFIIAGGLFETCQLAAFKQQYLNTPSKIVKPKVISTIIGVLFIFLGVSIWGIIGAIGAIILTSIIQLIWILYINEQL